MFINSGAWSFRLLSGKGDAICSGSPARDQRQRQEQQSIVVSSYFLSFYLPNCSQSILYSRLGYRTMLSSLARHRLCLATRQRSLTALHRLTIRSTSTSTSVPPSAGLKGSTFKQHRIAYAAGGTSVAILGLLWTRRDGGNYPDDPRDVRALSTVPLTKLLSGWM